MARFFGMVGYGVSEDRGNGIWELSIVERPYYGDVTRNTKQTNAQTNTTNDDINVNNTISIVSDTYAIQNFSAIRYVTWMGTRWKVTGVEVDPDRPRLNLSVGGVYNGPKPANV